MVADSFSHLILLLILLMQVELNADDLNICVNSFCVNKKGYRNSITISYPLSIVRAYSFSRMSKALSVVR